MRAKESGPAFANELFVFPDRRDDSRLLAWALLAAACLHLVFFFVNLPDSRVDFPVVVKDDGGITLNRVDLPPPPQPKRHLTNPHEAPTPQRLIPVPAAAPAEPVPERSSPPSPEVWTADMPVLLAEASAPAAVARPRIPGIDGVTRPVLILESKGKPIYPELARQARIEGRVILQAVIGSDGIVSEVEVLQCDRSDVGFEQAAVEAVRQWRYEPAQQFGVPVDVYFTIVVEFTLQ